SLVLLIVLLPLVGLAVSFGSIGVHWNEATRAAPDRQTSTGRQARNGATSAAVRVHYGIGALDVGPIQGDISNDVLVDGEVFGHGCAGFDTRYDVRDRRGMLRI